MWTGERCQAPCYLLGCKKGNGVSTINSLWLLQQNLTGGISGKKNWEYGLNLISRARSFPRPAEFCVEPRNLGFCRGIRLFAAEFGVFHSNKKMTSK